jgi:hypothetical protein
MERDTRRDRGEWRGCHSFDKIVCDGDRPTRSERRGGLKMGQTYYYYVSTSPRQCLYNSLGLEANKEHSMKWMAQQRLTTLLSLLQRLAHSFLAKL